MHYNHNYFPLSFTDADKNPVEDLTSLAALDMKDILSKTDSISRGVLFNMHQSVLKEWGPDSLGVLPEDRMQELLTGVTIQIDPDLVLSLTSVELFQQTLPTVCILT